MSEPFEPTHWLRIGTGRKRTYWRVRLIGPVGRGKEDGLRYYHAITSPYSPHHRHGIHTVSMVPETRLRPIKRKEH